MCNLAEAKNFLFDYTKFGFTKNLEKNKNLILRKIWNLPISKNFQIGIFEKLSIWKIPEISNLKNSKNFQFREFEIEFSITKIEKIVNLKNSKNLPLGKFQ